MSDTLEGVRHKKLQAGKPDSVVGYHLSVPAVTRGTQAAYPVTCTAEAELGRAVLEGYYMWHFSMQGLPANDVTIKSRRLLPYVFTFTL